MRHMFLGITAVLIGICAPVGTGVAQQGNPAAPEPLKVAFICTYYGVASHANHIATRFFAGFNTDDGIVAPRVKIVSMYIDQPSPDGEDLTDVKRDIGRKIAAKNGVKIYPTIADALTLGGETLAVDGVIYIGEQGEYPRNRFGAEMHPRMNHLEQIFRVFDASNKSVPVFSDKHLSCNWIDARWVYDRARELKVPMMAGSSTPVAWRTTGLEHPLGARITEAVGIGYGPLDSYGFHVLEMMQCHLERRHGGETGIASVQCLKGPAVWEAADAGKFSLALAQAACDTIKEKRPGTLREVETNPTAILVTYRDGTKATMMLAGRYVGEHRAYAADVGGHVVATETIKESSSSSHFSYLCLNIEQMMLTGKPTAPVERTLLTSGIIDMATRSLSRGGEVIPTPFLDVVYSAEGYAPMRATNPRPIGASVGPWPPAEYAFTALVKAPSTRPAGSGSKQAAARAPATR